MLPTALPYFNNALFCLVCLVLCLNTLNYYQSFPHTTPNTHIIRGCPIYCFLHFSNIPLAIHQFHLSSPKMVASKFTEHLEEDKLVFDHEKSVSLEDILQDNRSRSLSTSSSSSSKYAQTLQLLILTKLLISSLGAIANHRQQPTLHQLVQSTRQRDVAGHSARNETTLASSQ